MPVKTITVALAGNPNSGKTTIFNSFTGLRQHVGNYPGVTVEKKEGCCYRNGYNINLVDLLGIYSLTAHSADEIVARNFILQEKPDVIADIIDSSNLERSLYLAAQLIELGVPLVLVFNMHDLAKKYGFFIDKERLSQLLGRPIVFTEADKKKGVAEIFDRAVGLFGSGEKVKEISIDYGPKINKELENLVNIINKDGRLTGRYPARWLAIKLLEGDSEAQKIIAAGIYEKRLREQAQKSGAYLKTIYADSPEAVIADFRYGFISGACSESVKKTSAERHSVSDHIDNVFLNKVLGLPLFGIFMWAVFKFIFNLSVPIVNLIRDFQGYLGAAAKNLIPPAGGLNSLVSEGIIGGVGSVVAFVPTIFFLFFAMAFLEFSGYMARVAFMMDNFMHKIGLHGRSFISMLLGFGCNVPAIMATRTIEDRHDRIVTILINPFMSCGARLPVYALFVSAFFPDKSAGNVLFSIYLLGMIVALVMAKLFRKFLFKGEAAPFVMELPPYRMPALKGVFIYSWEKVLLYFKKAGTIIFAASIVVWLLGNFPRQPSDIEKQSIHQTAAETGSFGLSHSYLSRLGRAITPVFEPLGFADWRVSVGLLGGFIAKETIISTLGTLSSSAENCKGCETLSVRIRDLTRTSGEKVFSPLKAYSFMVFVLLYVPCAAVIAVVRKETGSLRWALLMVLYTTAVAWIISFAVYQGGRLLGVG